MDLPVLKTPTYTLTIPSTKKKVKYRPFLVKEEKIMLLVKESKDDAEMLNAMKEIVKTCTFGVVDPETLSVFDIEYMFMQLRSKSVGEIVELVMKCINRVPLPTTDGVTEEMIECGNSIDFMIDISKINVNFPKDHSNVIMLDDVVGITFKYPSIDTLFDVDSGKDNFEVIVDLIENIFDKDNVYDAKDSTPEQLSTFIDNLSNNQYKDIMNKFFKTMPSMEYVHHYKCNKCGYEGSYTFRGIADFF